MYETFQCHSIGCLNAQRKQCMSSCMISEMTDRYLDSYKLHPYYSLNLWIQLIVNPEIVANTFLRKGYNRPQVLFTRTFFQTFFIGETNRMKNIVHREDYLYYQLVEEQCQSDPTNF